VDKYTDNYIVYDKTGELLESDKIKHLKNVGYNIYDYFYFIIENYTNLPDICIFIKGNVFKHCKEETFSKLIKNNIFTPLEDYSYLKEDVAYKKDIDGGYMELNNEWYCYYWMGTYGEANCKYYKSYNKFMFDTFSDFVIPTWVRFAPGANYLVPKENILYYSKTFYQRLLGLIDYCQLPLEAQILERALYYIFSNKWREK
jgi:hypothetical protein